MEGMFDVRLSRLELENIRLALVKRAFSMEIYLIRSRDLKNDSTLRRDIGISRDLAKKVAEVLKNGGRTWSV